MGKVVKSVSNVAKKAVSGAKKFVSNPIGGAVTGGLIGGPIGAVAGGFLGSGAGGGDERDQVTGRTVLNPSGQQQFDFSQNQLTSALRNPINIQQANFGEAQSALRGIDFGGINRATGALQDFSGTGAAKSALNRVGGFKGTPEAFRTLAALERFGQQEQDFVRNARESVLSFDEGFQSEALPLLRNAAEGDFLTEQAGNPFIRDLINTAQRPVIENFREDVLPGILSTFAGSGGVGSSLRGAFTGQQARDLQRNLGDISSTIGFNVFESERAKQLAAQEAILGFEGQGLDRELGARTTNLAAAQNSAQQLLQARQAAGAQATNLSQQRLAALQAAASGQVQLSAQRQASLAAALQGRLGSGQLKAAQGGAFANIAGQQQATNTANAQLERDRIQQLLEFQRNSQVAGKQDITRLIKPGL